MLFRSTCSIFLRPTKSLGLFIQQAGRALRTIYADGYDLSTVEGRLAAIAESPKPPAILLDHAGLTYGHGLIDDPRAWSLAGQKKRKGKKQDQDQRLRRPEEHTSALQSLMRLSYAVFCLK